MRGEQSTQGCRLKGEPTFVHHPSTGSCVTTLWQEQTTGVHEYYNTYSRATALDWKAYLIIRAGIDGAEDEKNEDG